MSVHIGKTKAGIEFILDGDVVTIVWRGSDQYEAMMFYDRLVEEAKAGHVSVSIAITSPVIEAECPSTLKPR